MIKICIIALSATLLPTFVSAQTADTTYVIRSAQADAGEFLPMPADVTDPDFTDDMIQWQWGKTQRNTPRGAQANRESLWLPSSVASVMSQALELDTISPDDTPALYRLLFRTYNTGDQSTYKAKEKYMRLRPFMQMGENTWAAYDTDFLRTNGSYPSGHSAFGMAIALAYAEMWPERQDTILRRGFQFAENRIITGAHYQSDVNAGMLCGAVSIALSHNNPEFQSDLLAARAEYIALKGLPADYDPTANVALPRGTKILNQPVDTASYRYVGELMRYWKAKTYRDTQRGLEAVANVDKTPEYMSELFGQIMGINITADETPALFQLIKTMKANSSSIVDTLKMSTFRKRPYVQLSETTPVPENEEKSRNTSSYASYHSCLGWSLALVFAQMDPEHCDDILKCGFQYGYSRLIVGYHWATDIEAARILASALVTRLYADPSFCELYDRACAEFRDPTTNKPITTITPPAEPTVTYDLNGIIRTEFTPGTIYIRNGKKEMKR